MRRIFSNNTLDTIKFFSVVFGLVAVLLIIFGFGMESIRNQYKQPYLVVEAPDNSYTARVYKTNKKEGVTISVDIYDKMSRLRIKNFYSQAYCEKIWISWKKIDELIINKVTMDLKSDKVKFTKKDENFCPETSVNN